MNQNWNGPESRGACEGGRNPDPMLIASFVDGTASEEDARAVERAMLNDPLFAAAVEEVRRLGRASLPEPPAGFVERMLAAVRESRRPPAARSRRRKYSTALVWAAATVAAVVFSFAGFELGASRSSADNPAVESQASDFFPEISIELIDM